MTLEKAIEFNLDTLQYSTHILDTKCFKALELAIEALKQIMESRKSFPKVPIRLLPGETKE